MKFKKLLESVNSEDLDGKYFYVNKPIDPSKKYVVALSNEDGDVYAQFPVDGDVVSTKTKGNFEITIVDYSKAKLEKNVYPVNVKNRYFEFKDRYGIKYEGDFDDEIQSLKKVEFKRPIVTEPMNYSANVLAFHKFNPYTLRHMLHFS